MFIRLFKVIKKSVTVDFLFKSFLVITVSRAGRRSWGTIVLSQEQMKFFQKKDDRNEGIFENIMK